MQLGNSVCLFCLFSSLFYFVGNKIAAYCFKYEITSSLKANYRIKCSQDVAMNDVREKEKPRRKLLYKVFNEEYAYNSLLEIYQFSTLIQLKDSLGGIHQCVIVVGKWFCVKEQDKLCCIIICYCGLRQKN